MELINSIFQKINVSNKSVGIPIENIMSIPTYSSNHNIRKFNEDNVCPEVRISIPDGKFYDIELGISSDSSDSSDSYDSTNLAKSNKNTDSFIGSGYSGINSLEWDRPNEKSDFKVKYKGKKYVISHLIISKIYSQTNTDVNEIIKLFIHNNFDENITLSQLLV